MRFAADCFRAHHPRWSALPLSGDGAAIHGGRFNPKGISALYLSTTMDGAVAEAAQGFAFKMEPLTICLYEIDCADIVDLSTPEGREATGVELDELACAWFTEASEGREPKSWALARRLIGETSAGVLVPSFARGAKPGATNLVLWRWGPDLPYRVVVHDPSGRLPADHLSWADR